MILDNSGQNIKLHNMVFGLIHHHYRDPLMLHQSPFLSASASASAVNNFVGSIYRNVSSPLLQHLLFTANFLAVFRHLFRYYSVIQYIDNGLMS